MLNRNSAFNWPTFRASDEIILLINWLISYFTYIVRLLFFPSGLETPTDSSNTASLIMMAEIPHNLIIIILIS